MNTPYKKDFKEFGLSEDELKLMDEYDLEALWDDVEVDDFSDLESGRGGTAPSSSSASGGGASAPKMSNPFADLGPSSSTAFGGSGGGGFSGGMSDAFGGGGTGSAPQEMDLPQARGGAGGGMPSGGGVPMPPRPAGSSGGMPSGGSSVPMPPRPAGSGGGGIPSGGGVPMPPRPSSGSVAPPQAQSVQQSSSGEGGGLMEMLQGASFEEFLAMLQENPEIFDQLMSQGNWSQEEVEFLNSIKPLIENKDVMQMLRENEHESTPPAVQRQTQSSFAPPPRPQNTTGGHHNPHQTQGLVKSHYIEDPDELKRIIEERNKDIKPRVPQKAGMPVKNMTKVWTAGSTPKHQAHKTASVLGERPMRVRPPAPPILMPSSMKKALSVNMTKRVKEKEDEQNRMPLQARPIAQKPQPKPVSRQHPQPQRTPQPQQPVASVQYPEFLQHFIRIWDMMSAEEKENVSNYAKEFSKDYTSFMCNNYPDTIPEWLQMVISTEENFLNFIGVFQNCVLQLQIPNPQNFIEGFAAGLLGFMDEMK